MLKKLLYQLDDLGIQHPDESSFHHQLWKWSDCNTTVNQLFPMKGSASTDINRTRADTRNLFSVIVPHKKKHPKAFFFFGLIAMGILLYLQLAVI